MTIVAKIGGKSQEKPERVREFVEGLTNKFGREEPILVVNSAMGKTTDELEDAMNNTGDISTIIKNHDTRSSAYSEVRNDYDKIKAEFITYNNLYKTSPHLITKLLVTPERFAALFLANDLARIRGRKVRWIDFDSQDFPLVATQGDRNYLSAAVDLNESLKKSNRVRKLLQEYDIVIPGFGGIYDYDNFRNIKTFGRGGSDESAFGCGYLFNADEIWICSDVEGIKQAVLEGEYERETETVPRIDIEEAKAGAFLGAKLPSQQALMPLEADYSRGRSPKVYVAHAQKLDGKKTEIIPSVDYNQFPAKFVAGRDIEAYYTIEGPSQTLIELEREVTEAGIDRRIVNTGGRTEIAVFGKGSKEADGIVRNYEKKGLSIEKDEDSAIVGVVGSGMKTTPGITARITSILYNNGINILSSGDYGGSSSVSIIPKLDKQKAIASLYEALEFIRNG